MRSVQSLPTGFEASLGVGTEGARPRVCRLVAAPRLAPLSWSDTPIRWLILWLRRHALNRSLRVVSPSVTDVRTR